MKILIILGGEIQDDFVCQKIMTDKYERIIAVDGGLVSADRMQIMPTDIVGDFDTAPANLLKHYQTKKEICIHKFPPEKDATDSQIAIELALSLRCHEIVVIGATGRRIDHTLGNIQLLSLPLNQNVKCILWDQNNRIRLIKEKTLFRKEELFGKYISILPFTQRVENITLYGFRYPLYGYQMDLFRDPSLGISNELVKDEGIIEFSEGILMVIESTD